MKGKGPGFNFNEDSKTGAAILKSAFTKKQHHLSLLHNMILKI